MRRTAHAPSTWIRRVNVMRSLSWERDEWESLLSPTSVTARQRERVARQGGREFRQRERPRRLLKVEAISQKLAFAEGLPEKGNGDWQTLWRHAGGDDEIGESALVREVRGRVSGRRNVRLDQRRRTRRRRIQNRVEPVLGKERQHGRLRGGE